MKKENKRMGERVSEYERNHEYWLNVGKSFLKCQRVLNNLLSELDISIAQHEIMLTLLRHSEMTHTELSEKLLVVKSNISNLVKKLAQRDLVEITQSTTDQRVKYLSLTNKGRALVKKSTAFQKRVVSAMVANSSEEELETTNNVMLAAIASLDQFG